MRPLPAARVLQRTLAFVLLGALCVAATSARPGREPKPASPLAVAPQATAARVPASCDPLPGDAPDPLPKLRSAIGLNYPNALLEHPGDGVVEICLLVDSTGTVREAGVSKPQDPFDLLALESARWWVFEPARRAGRAVPARITVRVAAHTPRDTDPLVPDVVALAEDAEARGELREALDAWSGTLARVGQLPSLQNEWTIREHVIRIAARLASPPGVPMMTEAHAQGQHALMLRNVSRGDNATYAAAVDEVLQEAPWYANAYRWRAAARAASGQRDGAVRDVLCYKLAVRDSASRALAERALVALARSDTLAALTLLKND